MLALAGRLGFAPANPPPVVPFDDDLDDDDSDLGGLPDTDLNPTLPPDDGEFLSLVAEWASTRCDRRSPLVPLLRACGWADGSARVGVVLVRSGKWVVRVEGGRVRGWLRERAL